MKPFDVEAWQQLSSGGSATAHLAVVSRATIENNLHAFTGRTEDAFWVEDLAFFVVKLAKRHPADDITRQRFAREADLLNRIAGGPAPLLLGGDATADRPWLALEYIDGPTLEQHVQTKKRAMDRDELWDFAAGTWQRVRWLHHHSEPVAHRDIQPRNTILPPTHRTNANLGEVIFVDWAGGWRPGQPEMREEDGSHHDSSDPARDGFRAPEQIMATGEVQRHTLEAEAAIDVWQWACCVYYARHLRGLELSYDELLKYGRNVAGADLPLEKINELPEGIRDAVLVALSRRREDRDPDRISELIPEVSARAHVIATRENSTLREAAAKMTGLASTQEALEQRLARSELEQAEAESSVDRLTQELASTRADLDDASERASHVPRLEELLAETTSELNAAQEAKPPRRSASAPAVVALIGLAVVGLIALVAVTAAAIADLTDDRDLFTSAWEAISGSDTEEASAQEGDDGTSETQGQAPEEVAAEPTDTTVPAADGGETTLAPPEVGDCFMAGVGKVLVSFEAQYLSLDCSMPLTATLAVVEPLETPLEDADSAAIGCLYTSHAALGDVTRAFEVMIAATLETTEGPRLLCASPNDSYLQQLDCFQTAFGYAVPRDCANPGMTRVAAPITTGGPDDPLRFVDGPNTFEDGTIKFRTERSESDTGDQIAAVCSGYADNSQASWVWYHYPIEDEPGYNQVLARCYVGP